MTDKTQPFWVRAIVMLNALVFLVFGAAFLLAPEPLAQWVDIELRSASALADVRAIYGGLPLAAGILFVLGLRRPTWLEPSLFLVMTSSGALAAARIYSTAVSGVPSALVWGFLASELFSLAWAALAYRSLRATPVVSLRGSMPAT